ncbi:MAG: glutaredoxin [Cyclobacteriaceae bacterium]|nr:glutaredoxin [Cyclobacteriaceae bacterium]
MHKYFYLIPFVVTLVAFTQCGSPQEKAAETTEVPAQKSIVIYGSNNCPHCIDFKAKLDARGITYTFNDVEFSDKLTLEMVEVVKSSNYAGQIYYPVVVVDNRMVFVNPELEVVISALQ